MTRYTARRLRLLGRAAKASGADPTDYSAGSAARSFVPYYAQRLSSTCVLEGAQGILQQQKRMQSRRLSGLTAM